MTFVPQKPFWPARWWWVGLAIILIVAGGLRFTGYNFSLPYIDHPDEAQFAMAAQMTIDNGSAKAAHYHAYPPGIITIHYLIKQWLEPTGTPLTASVEWVRLITVGLSLVNIVVVALLAYRFYTPFAGLIAASIWAVLPYAILQSRFATPNTYIACFVALAVFLVLSGTQYDIDDLTLAGSGFYFLAVLFKYQALFIGPVILFLPLVRLVHCTPDQRTRIWRNFGHNLTIIALFLFWLVFIFPLLEANDVPAWVAPTDTMQFPSMRRLLLSATEVSAIVEDNLLVLAGLGGLLLAGIRQFRALVNWFAILTALAAILLMVIGLSFFDEQGSRQHFGATTFLVGLLGVGFALGADLAGWGLTRILNHRVNTPPHLGKILGSGSVSIILLVFLLPHFQVSATDAYERTRHDRRNDLTIWMDTSLEGGPFISPEANHKTFNRIWGGYNGVQDFDHLPTSGLAVRPIEDWRADGALYAIPSYGEYTHLQETNPSYLAAVTLLKTYPPAPPHRGPSMVVMRLYPIQHEAAGQLGPINLIGYDLDRKTVAPGEALTFRQYWQATAPTDTPYVVFNHLVLPEDRNTILAQIDGPPFFDEAQRRTTVHWDDPQETLVSREFVLPVAADVPPGEYRLVTGFYRPDTGERLLTSGGEDFLLLTTIQVTTETVGTD